MVSVFISKWSSNGKKFEIRRIFWGRNVADTLLCNYSNGKLKFCVLTDVDSFKSPFLLDYLFIVTGLDITFQKHL